MANNIIVIVPRQYVQILLWIITSLQLPLSEQTTIDSWLCKWYALWTGIISYCSYHCLIMCLHLQQSLINTMVYINKLRDNNKEIGKANYDQEHWAHAVSWSLLTHLFTALLPALPLNHFSCTAPLSLLPPTSIPLSFATFISLLLCLLFSSPLRCASFPHSNWGPSHKASPSPIAL